MKIIQATAARRVASRQAMRGDGASQLDPSVVVRQTPITSFGSVADAPGFQGISLGMPSSFTVTCDNSAGVAAAIYKVGDGQGIIAANTGLTLVAPTSGTTSIAGLNGSFGVAPVTVKGIVYDATSGATQFAQLFRYAMADVDGSAILKNLNIPEYKRPTNYNPNELVLGFDVPFRLDWNCAFLITVAAGQTVTATFITGAATYR